LLIEKGQNKNGHLLALGASLALLAGMGPRAVSTRKFMPAGNDITAVWAMLGI